MREITYKEFSFKTHKKNWYISLPNSCQFELTFKCGLHCQHCYIDCYNKDEYINKELKTKDVIFILNKIYKSGIIWLCLTGGDPLCRTDFLKIYDYAKGKGFIITIFTNGYSMTEEIALHLKNKPPFVLELTLNSLSCDTYDKISKVDGSFDKTMRGLNFILKAKLPLKIKTQVTRENIQELPEIENFVKKLGLKFRPDFNLSAKLDGDCLPCDLRVSHQEVLDFYQPRFVNPEKVPKNKADFFSCTIGTKDGIYLDPYGNIVPCQCIRDLKLNLLQVGIKEAQKAIADWLEEKRINPSYECRFCSLKKECKNCPGYAWLEKKDLGGKIEWFCELTRFGNNRKIKVPCRN